MRPEDRVTNTVADAAAYERWRAQDDPKDDDERGDVDEDRGCPHRCRCHSRSLDPCDYCTGDCCPRSET